MTNPAATGFDLLLHMATELTRSIVQFNGKVKDTPRSRSRVPHNAAMNYWLIKFAPFRTSWQDIVRQGQFTLRGVKSHEARKHLSAMDIGDKVLFCRSQKAPAIMGILEVARTAYSDPTSADAHWLTCDFQPVKSISGPITLQSLRSVPELKDFRLLRQPRLSVMPVERQEWTLIEALIEERERLNDQP